MLIAALEAGGENMICSIGNPERGVMQRASIATGSPETTMPRIIDFFSKFDVKALGVGSFGPLDLDPASEHYGSITGTPKAEWKNYPLLKTLVSALGVPGEIDTAVNAAALAEHRMGAGRGARSMLYLSVGAGVGGGWIVNGRPLHGLTHPEAGHMLITPEKDDPMPEGVCPFHKHCAEGAASAPSMERRWGLPPRLMTEDHPAWALEAKYIAQICANAVVMMSPERIVIGGSVMRPHLYPLIRRHTLELLGGYVVHEYLTEAGAESYIVPPQLGMKAGVTGALLLGVQALQMQERESYHI